MRNTDNKKDNKVLMSLRISAEDKEQIEEKARKTGLTTSEYIRRCALGRKLPVRRHIVRGANRTLISVATPPRSCCIGTRRRLSAE